MAGLSALVAGRPRTVLAALAVVTLLALAALWDFEAGAPRLELDPSVGQLLRDDDPARRFYERVRRVFGSEEAVLIAVAADDVFSAGHLATIARMTEQLQRLPRVRRVVSLTNVSSMTADAEGVEFRAAGSRDLADPGERARLREDVLGNPLYRNTLIGDDERVSSITVHFDKITDREFVEQRVAQRIYQIVDEHSGNHAAWVTGAPIVKAAIADALIDSLRVTLPSILAIAAALLFLAFRSLRAVLLPVVAIAVALVWTLALPALLGVPLNVVTILVPPLVMALGLAYAMHVVSDYHVRVAHETDGGAGTARGVLSEVGLPLVVSAATTALGLAALALNTLSAVREFAVLAIIGVLFAAAVVLTLIPAVLALLRPPHGAADIGGVAFRRLAQRLVIFATRRRRSIVVAAVVVLAVAAAGALQIETGTAYTGGLAEDVRARSDFEAVNATLGGANSFYIAIEAEGADRFVEPDALAALENLQLWLDEQPEVYASVSLADHLKLISRTLNEGDERFYALPASRPLAKQLLFFGGGDEIDNYVDATYRFANVLVRIGNDDTREISSLFERIEDRLRALPDGLDATITGNLMLATRTVDNLARGQLLSVGVALLAVLAVLATMFASLRTGMIAFFPNLLPVVAYFGALGLFGVTLNPTTGLIACIALGIAVDDTIHFMVRFNTEARATGREGTAVQRALAGVIRPVTYTSIIVVLSFLLLTTSDLRNQVEFGALAAMTIALAWLIDLTLTPALSSGLRIVTLWDLLRLDLGSNPQKSIAMLEGLSLRQARIFALMADLSRYDAGSTLMTEGDEATDEMFVVIDGELEAWVQRDGKKVTFSRMRRGTTFGEAGLFGERRSANVSVVSRARLLRFTNDDLERLESRFPRIAAVVYRNINRIQAERATRDTQRAR